MLYVILLIFFIWLAIKHGEWWLMALCSMSAFIMSSFGIQGVAEGIEWADEHIYAYELFIGRIILLLTGVMSVALLRNKKEDQKKELEDKKALEAKLADVDVNGFTAENEYQPKPGWIKFVRLLCERLAKTKLEGESFALGIAGEWGSGKTTFLKQMKPELEKTFRVVEFNPWACMNAKSVAADFFDALKEQMPTGSQSIQRDINKYVRLLAGAGVLPNTIETIAEFVAGTGVVSISSLKAAIEHKLEEAKTRYVVLMDDLDRLESQELFETLRLIRITANFSNILFVVAYDRHHIIDMLSANGISNGEQFIKKIFSTEIVMPEMEPYTMPTLLMDEISRLVGDGSPVPQAIDSAVHSKGSLETYELLTYLKNYRDVKRFAMAFAVDAYAVEKNTPGEFSYQNFFWLEILRYVDYDVYDDLRTNPLKYLQCKEGKLYIQKDLAILKDKTEAAAIIQKLFGEGEGPYDMNEVRFVNNFRNYFSFRVQDNKVSQAEYEELLRMSDVETMKSSLDHYRMQGKLMSLYEMIRQTEMMRLKDLDTKKKYLSLLFLTVPYFNRIYSSTIREKLKEENFKEEYKTILADHVKSLIKDMVNDGKIHRGLVNVVISKLYSCFQAYDMDDEGGRYDYKSIVDDDFLVEASANNLRKILSKRIEIVDIVGSTMTGSALRMFMENATVNDWTNVSYEPVTCHYKCLPFSAFLEYFKEHKSDRLNDFMKPLEFDEEEQKYLDEEPSIFDGRKTTIHGIFGSDDNFKTIINECFSNSQKEKDKWVKYWNLK